MLNKPVFAVAPMLDITDKHCRYFFRLLSRRTLLYTEMVSTGAILRGPRDRFLSYDVSEHPVALQLGGSCPVDLAHCTKIAEDYGYDEVNLNVGCPSDRVQSAKFGACLMAAPQLVAECIAAMQAVTSIPVTVKSRIGIDDRDSYEELVQFIEIVANAGCKTFIIHARKAWLQGLSPKENREIPPLRYDIVRQIKREFPHLAIIINGGINNLKAAEEHLSYVDGVMMGRAIVQNPYLLAIADEIFYSNGSKIPTRFSIVEQYIPYAARQLATGVRLSALTRPLLGLFHEMPHARAWRRYISENAHLASAGVEVLHEALKRVERI
jgi:tRNA-dihydrouridine synthase A